MDPSEFEDRISRINTVWTMVLAAHSDEREVHAQAQVAVLERYRRAVYRYLLGAVRDADAADELFQEFALQFVRGQFHGADPQKGRFRDYIKTALFHLVGAYHKRRARQPYQADSALLQGAAAAEDSAEADAEFQNSWRDEALAAAWTALQRLEQEQGGLLYTLLHFRTTHPDHDSARMAAELSTQLGRPLTAAAVRQTIHRGRAKFAELLLDEVARTLPAGDLDALEQEVIDLGLHAYCADALQRRRA